MTSPKRSVIFGMPFDDIGMDPLIRELGANPGGFRYLVTPNVDHVVRLSRRPALYAAYEAAAFSLCDSRVLFLLSRFRHAGDLAEVIPGSDLTARLFSELIAADTPLTLIGGADEVAEALVQTYGLARLRHYNPPMGFIDSPAEVAKAVEFALAEEATFIFICLGSPQQELLARAIADTGRGRGTALCVGASIGFLTGHERRAPRWMQTLALEWLFRLLHSPRRLFRRYLVDAWGIFPLFLRDLLAK